jgi:2-polyprenyl-3-methyl-5-hydroxy-6-metoxy-1,4-benzoquinol methylase
VILRDDGGLAASPRVRYTLDMARGFLSPSSGRQAFHVEYDPTQFAGTAPYYLRGRPPYSDQLGDVLVRELGLDRTGSLLDVGCGPGTLGIQLAPLFEHVTLLEPDG